MKARWIGLVGLLLAITACKKDRGNLTIHFQYEVDGQFVEMDTLRYMNAAGERFSITHLEYYLCDLELEQESGAAIMFADVWHEDISASGSIHLEGLPLGKYTGLKVFLGVDDARNVPGGLPNTIQNNAMVWPEPMGGGYHFMKLEGHWLDSLSQMDGFAMHLGKSGNQVRCSATLDLSIEEGANALDLTMDISEWFKGPHTYSLAQDGAYIMTDDSALKKLRENGVDVFRQR